MQENGVISKINQTSPKASKKKNKGYDFRTQYGGHSPLAYIIIKVYMFFCESAVNAWEIVYKIGGVYKLYIYWAKNGYKETPQEVAELVGL